MAKKTVQPVAVQALTPEDQIHELASKLMKISNKLRGKVDASQFKDYILGIIFYRYLSEQTVDYIESLLKKDNKTYLEAINDHEYNEAIADILADAEDAEGFEASFSGLVKYWSISHLGYVIEPKYLFSNLYRKALIKEDRTVNPDKFSVDDLDKALKELVKSTEGHPSEPVFNGLFDDVLSFSRLGKQVEEQSRKIAQLIVEIGQLSFNIKNAKIDILGTAYMELIGQFASQAGKKAGEFFTPICASKLLAKLATVGLEEAKYVCDPAAGSGSLLLQVKEALPKHQIIRFYGQEYVDSTYSLLRMNLLLHKIPYTNFTVYNDDTLNNDNFYDDNTGKPIKFTVQVANPPFSTEWTPKLNLKDDPRYKSGGLPSTQYGEMGFVEHMAYHMDEDGRVAVILPHGVTTRKEEYNIRKYLIDKNYVDAIISLPANMFHTTSSAVLIMVLKKNRNGNADNILFINASKDFTKGRPKNYLTDEQIDRIVQAYIDRKNIDKYSSVVPIAEIIDEKKNDYNLSINRYVNNSENEEFIDIQEKREELKTLNIKVIHMDLKLQNWFKQLGI